MRQILVEGDKTFKIQIPDDAKVTYGPWAPPRRDKEAGGFNNMDANKRGTLRIYQNDGKSIIACFAGVTSFRDLSLIDYQERIAVEEGAAVWKSDSEGYKREDRIEKRHEWQSEPKLIAKAGKKK